MSKQEVLFQDNEIVGFGSLNFVFGGSLIWANNSMYKEHAYFQ
jgi:hypothetical protein